MNISTSLALFGSMVVLALIPGPGVLVVTGRTMSGGIYHGIVTTVGIVAGDYVFITFTLLGLVALSELMGSFFVIIKYIGGVYLIFIGVSLFRSKVDDVCHISKISKLSYSSSFVMGLFTTLGNPKAILFYLSFLPAFLNLSQVSILDIVLLYSIATIAVGGVMFGYAYVV